MITFDKLIKSMDWPILGVQFSQVLKCISINILYIFHCCCECIPICCSNSPLILIPWLNLGNFTFRLAMTCLAQNLLCDPLNSKFNAAKAPYCLSVMKVSYLVSAKYSYKCPKNQVQLLIFSNSQTHIAVKKIPWFASSVTFDSKTPLKGHFKLQSSILINGHHPSLKPSLRPRKLSINLWNLDLSACVSSFITLSNPKVPGIYCLIMWA